MSKNIEDDVANCLRGICSEFIIKSINCLNLNDAGHGAYIIIYDNKYLTGYSRSLSRRLRMYCLGQLSSRGVFRLLMSELDKLLPSLSSIDNPVSRRSELPKIIRSLIDKAQVLVIKCPSMTDKELYIRLNNCLKQRN